MKKIKIIFLVLVIVMVSLFPITTFAADSKNEARVFYEDLIDTLIKEMKKPKVTKELDIVKKGKLEYDITQTSKVSDYYKEFLEEYYGSYSLDSGELDVLGLNAEETTQNIKFDLVYDLDKELYMVLIGNNTVMLDMKENKLYTKEANEKFSFVSEMPKEVSEYVTNLLENFDELKENQSSYLGFIKVLEAVKASLKDEYFEVNKNDGINEFKIKMDVKEIVEFFDDVIDKLKDDDEFINMIVEKQLETSLFYLDYYTKEELKEDLIEELDDFKEDIKELRYDTSFEFATFVKGKNLIGIVGVECNCKLAVVDYSDTYELSFKLSGERNKSLLTSKEFVALFNCKEGDNEESNEFKIEFIMQKNKVSLNFVMDINEVRADDDEYWNYMIKWYGMPEVEELDWQEYREKYNEYMSKAPEVKRYNAWQQDYFKLSLTTDDGKAFDEANRIEVLVELGGIETNLDNNSEISKTNEKMQFVLESKGNKKLKESSEIEFFAIYEENKIFEVKCKALDNKAIGKSTDVKLEVNVGEENIMEISVKTNDKKAFGESKEIEMLMKLQGEEILKFTCRALDNRAIGKSTNVKLELNVGKENIMEISIKTNDKKAFTESKNIEMLVKLQGEEILEFKMNEKQISVHAKINSSSFYRETKTDLKIKLTIDDVNDFNKINMKNAKEISVEENEEKAEKILEEVM